jgi:hypothetical protein
LDFRCCGKSKIRAVHNRLDQAANQDIGIFKEDIMSSERGHSAPGIDDSPRDGDQDVGQRRVSRYCGWITANRTLLPVAPTGVAMPPRAARFGNRDRFELNGKIVIAPGGRIIVHRECRQWQHNVALSGCIPLQPATRPVRNI